MLSNVYYFMNHLMFIIISRDPVVIILFNNDKGECYHILLHI